MLGHSLEEVCILFRELLIPCPEPLELLLSQKNTRITLLNAFGEVFNLALGFLDKLLHRR